MYERVALGLGLSVIENGTNVGRRHNYVAANIMIKISFLPNI